MPEERKHLEQTAAYWFNQSRIEEIEKGNRHAALKCMENAYNHVTQQRNELLRHLRQALVRVCWQGCSEARKLVDSIDDFKS